MIIQTKRKISKVILYPKICYAFVLVPRKAVRQSYRCCFCVCKLCKCHHLMQAPITVKPRVRWRGSRKVLQTLFSFFRRQIMFSSGSSNWHRRTLRTWFWRLISLHTHTKISFYKLITKRPGCFRTLVESTLNEVCIMKIFKVSDYCLWAAYLPLMCLFKKKLKREWGAK